MRFSDWKTADSMSPVLHVALSTEPFHEAPGATHALAERTSSACSYDVLPDGEGFVTVSQKSGASLVPKGMILPRPLFRRGRRSAQCRSARPLSNTLDTSVQPESALDDTSQQLRDATHCIGTNRSRSENQFSTTLMCVGAGSFTVCTIRKRWPSGLTS